MARRIVIIGSFIFVGILSTMSCTFFSGSKDIQQQIVDKALMDTTKCVRLKDITMFDWDTMYFFWSSDVNPNVIDSVVGSDVWDDLSHQIVFIKNRKVVYREDILDDPDKKENASFNFPDTLPFECLTPQTSIFKIRSRYGPGGDMYDIIPCK
jgi:hypothetical protein